MPTEVILFVLGIMAFVAVISKWAFEHEREKLRLKGGGQQSMTTSELRALIQEAVGAATEPLEERLGRIERALPAHEMEPPAEPLPLPDVDEEPHARSPEGLSRRRVR
jgi:hypothetical protein